MTRIKKRIAFQPHLLATAIALGISAPAHAINFNIGEIEGQFDSSLSVGASWAVRDADPDFVSNFNSLGRDGNGAARVIDDGRLNFRKGETFSKIFKGTHDLELKYGDSGVFVRGKYWYDFELKDESQHFYDIDDTGRDRAAKSSGAMFLDAFVYHNYNLGELPGNVRLGKQVVSWGESTFIGNSINSINPVDVAALRRPGSEVKEGLIPVNMFYMSQGLAENLNLEGFYQLEWSKTVVDNCGTFFSVDGVAQGCNDRTVSAIYDLPPGAAANTSLVLAQLAAGLDDVYLPRAKDNDARDGGQFGLAMRWFLPELNDTELGAYAMNYHSRTPYISGIGTTVPNGDQFSRVRRAAYFDDFPEDIRLYGLSFQTNVEGASLGGELSYRPNMPLQINTTDMQLSAANQRVPNQAGPLASAVSYNGPGVVVPGYERKPMYQAQMTATQFFDQVMGAERLTLVGEVGYTHLADLGSTDGSDVRFGRNPVFGPGGFPGARNAQCVGSQLPTGLASPATRPSNPQQECNGHGFYTQNSWGYRARASLNYANVIAGINFTPSLAWSHDVEGYGPTFEEGAKAVSLGLDADYRNTYTASLSYTDFFGGHYNTQVDRDFVALSFGVNF